MICPACGSTAVHVGPTSRRTESVVARCSACRAQFLVEETTEPTAVVTTDEVSVEYVSDWVGKKREGVGPAVWHEKLAWLSKEVADIDKPKLYDVGAGAGEFLSVAREEYGFDVAGGLYDIGVRAAWQRLALEHWIIGWRGAVEGQRVWLGRGEPRLMLAQRIARTGGIL